MSDDTRAWKDQYMLRFPEGMRGTLKKIAAQNGRSLNSEITERLIRSLNAEPDIAAIVKAAVKEALAESRP